MKKPLELSRTEKLILVMYKMSEKDRNLKFEDIVVNAFQKFPEDFHLRSAPSKMGAISARNPNG